MNMIKRKVYIAVNRILFRRHNMAARPIEPEEFQKALELFCVGTGRAYSEGEDQGKKRFLLSPGGEAVCLEDGKIISSSQDIYEKLCETIMDMRAATQTSRPVIAPKTATSRPARVITPPNQEKPRFGAITRSPATVRDIQVAEMTLDDIKEFICPSATDQEAMMFLRLCQARNLNPFTREAYLVKYGGRAAIIVGKEAFTRKAELNPQFDGFSAGIIVKNENGKLEDLQGTFYDESTQKLVGGWAEVRRKDRNISFVSRVSMKEFEKDQPMWRSMPATMIRKIALVSALREAFPSDLSGCYTSDELGVEEAD